MNITSLETPSLILDKQKLKKNISGLNTHLKKLGVDLRPHGKTAKNIDIIKLALNDLPERVTVSTVKEAEYYFANGINDIIYAVGIAPSKLDRIVSLIKRGATIAVILDSIDQAKIVSAKAREHNVRIPVLIEFDCDGHRGGLAVNDSQIIEIGKFLNSSDSVSLAGVLTHAGESYKCKSIDDIRAHAEHERSAAVNTAELLQENNLPCPIVSVGSTPTASFGGDFSGVTEVRAGVYIFYDLVMAGLGVCEIDDIALSVLATVIGHQKSKGWAIVDAGWTALSSDRGTAGQKVDQGYGLVCDAEGRPRGDLIVSAVSQEHGIISNRNGDGIDYERFKIGDTVRILPNHACAAATMHNRYYVTDGGLEIVDIWDRVTGW